MSVIISGNPAPDVTSATTDGTEQHVQRRTPHRTLPLPQYDIRLRREMAQRRLLVSIGRQILRIATLHLLDAAAVAGAIFAAATVLPIDDLRRLWPSLVGLVLIGLNANGAYRPGEARRDGRRLTLGVAMAALTVGVLTLLPPQLELPVVFLPSFAAACLAALLAERWLVDLVIRQAYAHGLGLRKAIVIGRQRDADEVIRQLESDSVRDHRILGFVTPSQVHDSSSLGTIDDLDSILDREDPAELIIAGSVTAEAARRISDACLKHGTVMIAVPSWARVVRGWAEPVKVGVMPGYHVHPARLGLPALIFKRVTDIALTSVAIMICAPLMTLIAIAIKLDTRGPVFFRQRRVGLGGREFMMLKFRSMAVRAESQLTEIDHLNAYGDGRLFKMKNDPRVTRVGRILRRFSLDELPQIFNIIRGDMSLVGPRPPVPREVGKYEPRHFVRLTVVPGLTGPWQVGGRNLITDFEEVVRLERAYIDDWSFGLDLRIMLKTIGVVISGKGAY